MTVNEQQRIKTLLAQLEQYHYEFYTGDLNIRTHVVAENGQHQQIGVPLIVRDTNGQHQFDAMLAYRDTTTGKDQLYTVALIFNDEKAVWVDVNQPDFETVKPIFLDLLVALNSIPQQP